LIYLRAAQELQSSAAESQAHGPDAAGFEYQSSNLVLLSLKLKDQLVSQALNLGAQICCFMSLKLMDLIPKALNESQSS
jgi:hypothetical protein